MNPQLIVVILLTAPFVYCHKLITILSDFTNDKDVEFFKTTLPWIVDNVGSDINLKYHFIDSGINSGPRQCVLLQLTRNTYLQADYLSCLVKGKSQAECITDLPINNYYLNRCLRFSVKSFVKIAEQEFRKYKVDATPFIILQRRKIVVDVTPQNLIKNICALYPNRPAMQPIGCIKPSPVPNEKQESESAESVPESTPSPDEKITTEKEPKSEGETKPKDQKQTDENSPLESETKPEKQQQPDQKPPQESETKSKEQNQADGNSASDSNTKSEEQKQPDKNPPPESETKPKEREESDENCPQEGEESETKPEGQNQPDDNSEEHKQPDEKSPPESETKSEQKNPDDNITSDQKDLD